MLQWPYGHGFPWEEEDEEDADEYSVNGCALAAQGGHLHVLKWARESYRPWDEKTCQAAAEGGHLKVWKWAREHDCSWKH